MKTKENYLDFVFMHNPEINWEFEDTQVVLQKVNKGPFHKIAQLFFKKPRISYIHLEEMGSFIWPLIDGEKSVYEVGLLVKEHFGDAAEPLYERLSVYFRNLAEYNFIIRKDA